ncbi:hypothetical protein PUN28_017637 [Cardiocondyla obscurior]|uniref:Uncharacterized protein n=1 Tax=Cardiocondyla obscurior TaxID=286306 RepID=A0AAW2EL48_9HYME
MEARTLVILQSSFDFLLFKCSLNTDIVSLSKTKRERERTIREKGTRNVGVGRRNTRYNEEAKFREKIIARIECL